MCRIKYLNLEDNRLGSKAANLIFSALLENRTLTKLNLSKNLLTDTVADQLRLLFACAESALKELYLFWNQLRGDSGVVIFPALAANTSLKVLDLSCNSLGLGLDCAAQLAGFLTTNASVVHLDISQNYFPKDASTVIALALETNKTIYGFHFSGNWGYVDSR